MFFLFLFETSGMKNIVRLSPRAFLLRVGECTTSNSQNSLGYTKTHSLWVFLIKTIWPTVAHYTERKTTQNSDCTGHTSTHANTHLCIGERSFQMRQFSCQTNKKQLDWFLGAPRYFSSLVVELDRETEHCPVLSSSYLSCLANDLWEMQSAYSSLWPSVSFI